MVSLADVPFVLVRNFICPPEPDVVEVRLNAPLAKLIFPYCEVLSEGVLETLIPENGLFMSVSAGTM